MKYIATIPVIFFAFTGCGGGGHSTPTVYPVAGSYYGTVVSSSDNSGNMGITTDASGNGNFAIQYPGEAAIQERFAPPISSVSGSTLTINGSIANTCNFSLTATMADANTLKGSYTLTCPNGASGSATFSLPRGTYTVSAKPHRMNLDR